MSSPNFKLKRTAAASRGFLATARFSCCNFGTIYIIMCGLTIQHALILLTLIFTYTQHYRVSWLSASIECLSARLLIVLHIDSKP